MAATIAFYKQRDRAALQAWNGGEGQNTSTCKGKVGVYTNTMPAWTADTERVHTLCRNLLRARRPWVWASSHDEIGAAQRRSQSTTRQLGPVWFREEGRFESPYGNGSWGAVPSPWRNDSVHVRLGTDLYLLMFLSEKWSFVAVRCADEHVSYGRLQVADEREIPEGRLVW